MSPPRSSEAWDAAPCGLLTLLPDGTVIEANRTFLSWIGREAGEVVGRLRLSELMSVGGRIYWETHLSPLLHVDRRVREVALELRSPTGRLPVLLTAEVTKDETAGGDVVRVALSGASERSLYERELLAARAAAERSEARVQLLQNTTAALSEALGVQAVADALAAASVGLPGAAAATVWVTDPALGLVARASAGDSGHAAVPPPSATLIQGLIIRDRGRIVVPLHGHAVLQGALAVVGSDDPGAEPLDVEVLTAIGQQAGLALERAQLHEQSADVARELQHSLLAVTPPKDDRYAVAAAYRPGVEMLEVGGDWYDVFLAAEGLLSVVVGDVVGRGLRAASAMGQLRSAVRAVADPAVGPARLLSRLDLFVEHVEAATMATLMYAEVELATGSMRYASAGHPPPLLLPAGGEPRLLWEGRSTPVGGFVVPEQRPEASVRLEDGDRLLLYTDGLVERRDRGLDEGLDLLVSAASKVGRAPLDEAVRSLTESMLRDELVRDDVCVLLLSWEGVDRERPQVAAHRAP